MVFADAMGVVVGTSHHEAMMRAQDEWRRHADGGITGGKWDYGTNAVTIGMRGDGDEPMTEGTVAHSSG